MEEENNQMEELFTAVMQATDGDKRQLNTAFMLLPSKKVNSICCDYINYSHAYIFVFYVF